MLFVFRHLRRKDQCAVYISYFQKFSTDPGVLKIRHSHGFVAVVLQIIIRYIKVVKSVYIVIYKSCSFSFPFKLLRPYVFYRVYIKMMMMMMMMKRRSFDTSS